MDPNSGDRNDVKKQTTTPGRNQAQSPLAKRTSELFSSEMNKQCDLTSQVRLWMDSIHFLFIPAPALRLGYTMQAFCGRKSASISSRFKHEGRAAISSGQMGWYLGVELRVHASTLLFAVLHFNGTFDLISFSSTHKPPFRKPWPIGCQLFFRAACIATPANIAQMRASHLYRSSLAALRGHLLTNPSLSFKDT